MIATKPLDLRSNLKKYMDYAFSGEPVVIARPKNQNVEYLARIDSSYEQLEKNQTISFSLDELRNMESDNWKPTQKVKDFMERMNNE